jgi:hypothetical protein
LFESRRRTEVGSLPFWLPASLVVHASLVVAVLFYSSPNQPSSPEVVWISEVTPPQTAHPVSPYSKGALAVSPTKPAFTALGEKDIRSSVAEKTVQAPNASSGTITDNSSDIAPYRGDRSGPDPLVNSRQPSRIPETSLLHATNLSAPEVKTTFGEQDRVQVPGLTITKNRDWQFGSFEDNKLTYSDPNSSIKVTVRESSSAAFVAQNFVRSSGESNENTPGPFGLTVSDSGVDSMARSQRVDWKLLDTKSFGVTAFGYRSEVGQSFEPLEQGKKNEFGKAGTSVIKAGGQVKIGAFGFGLAQSSITDTDATGSYFGSTDSKPTLEQEASASVNLPQLVPGHLASKVLPVLWMSASTSQAPSSGQPTSETLSTSVGGTWTWNVGYASLGYWNYSSMQDSVAGATWSGHGFDANVGAHRSSFGIDAGLSYGQSEDTVPSWKSAGALYNSYATVWYKPDKLPGISLTAAAGNYDRNEITYGGTLSDPYAMTSNGGYLSLTAGLDLTSLFWSSEGSEPVAGFQQRPSVKMFYRYSDNLYVDGSADATRNLDSLIAMSIQRRF